MLQRLLIVLGLLLILGNITTVSAHDVLQGDQCVIEAETRMEHNLFVLCGTLIVNGEIDGNLFGGASKIVIDGVVNGSLYLVGGQLDIGGRIGGDIHFAGGVLHVKPSAQLEDTRADLISLALSTLLEEASISGSVTSVGYQLLLDSPVEREVSFWGSALTIDNTINGDVTATVGDPASTGVTQLRTLLNFNFLPVEVNLINPGLRISETGMVAGQLRYEGPVEGEISADLPHPPEFTLVENEFTVTAEESVFEQLRNYAEQAIREFISLALIGAVGLLLIPRTLQAPIYSLRVRPLPSLGVGLLTFIISFPIFLIVILFSIALVLLLSVLQLGDLALIGGVIVNILNLGGAGLFYFMAIFVSRVIVCIALGRFSVRLLFGDRPERYMTYVSLLFGVLLLALAASLPYVGWLINALAAFFGLGAILNLIQRQLDIARDTVPPIPTHPEEARQLPPPIIEDKPLLGPGMDNLPDGFRWWE